MKNLKYLICFIILSSLTSEANAGSIPAQNRIYDNELPILNYEKRLINDAELTDADTDISIETIQAKTSPSSDSAMPKLNNNIILRYTGYGFGVPLITAEFGINFNNKIYVASSNVETTGLGAIFINFSYKSAVTGSISNKMAYPRSFKSYAKSSEKVTNVAIGWNRNNYPIYKTNPKATGAKLEEVKKNIRIGLKDPYSTIISMGLASKGNPCLLREKIFDGYQIIQFKGKTSKITKVNKRDKDIIYGNIYECNYTHKPLAGVKEKYKKENNATISFQKVTFLPSKNTFYLPTNFNFKAKIGKVSINLRSSEYNGSPIKLAVK